MMDIMFGNWLISIANRSALQTWAGRKVSARVRILPRQYLPLVCSTTYSKEVKPRVIAHCAQGFLWSSPNLLPTSQSTAKFWTGYVPELMISQRRRTWNRFRGSFGRSFLLLGQASSRYSQIAMDSLSVIGFLVMFLSLMITLGTIQTTETFRWL